LAIGVIQIGLLKPGKGEWDRIYNFLARRMDQHRPPNLSDQNALLRNSPPTNRLSRARSCSFIAIRVAHPVERKQAGQALANHWIITDMFGEQTELLPILNGGKRIVGGLEMKSLIDLAR
jgi:hypothetical protein